VTKQQAREYRAWSAVVYELRMYKIEINSAPDLHDAIITWGKEFSKLPKPKVVRK